MDVEAIWWRRITAGDFLAIERTNPPLGAQGGMQTYIDVPKSGVDGLARVLGIGEVDSAPDGVSVQVRVAQDPEISAPLTIFHRLGQGGRNYIAHQRVYGSNPGRHPAWRRPYAWPHPAPPPSDIDDVQDVIDAGLTIYLARGVDGAVYAGFATGLSGPEGMPPALSPLFGSATDHPRVGTIEEPDVTLADLVAVTAEDEIADALVDVRPLGSGAWRPQRSGGGQGYGLTHGQRQALERESVRSAAEYFHGLGFRDILDTGSTHPYDLTMTKNGFEYIVEVKGTTTAGAQILLTTAEVQAHRERAPFNFLYIQRNMTLIKTEPPIASDGMPRVIEGWIPDDDDLTPLTYRYEVPTD